MPSFTSKTVPTSRTSMAARSAAWISLRRRFFSSPGRRMESVAIGQGLGVRDWGLGFKFVKNITNYRAAKGGEDRRWGGKTYTRDRVRPLRNLVNTPRGP